jgi:hypothetical protein
MEVRVGNNDDSAGFEGRSDLCKDFFGVPQVREDKPRVGDVEYLT